ncbi:DUF1816 domain-containing protein [Fischerella sp. PCC 9605]|uniref:DUF1816 domain-containing protein n=1 Tax=Fischerella sp. PCC 9605 TaxID=1173024 RepID=UPI00054DE474|nr:DUF1816 domain-containing protein [Fischerella sp. PCC 9605]
MILQGSRLNAMKLLNFVKGIIASFTRSFTRVGNKDWWVETIAAEPRCVYYFGPFQSPLEAILNSHQCL